jgi:hypothetical protein
LIRVDSQIGQQFDFDEVAKSFVYVEIHFVWLVFDCITAGASSLTIL